MQLELEPRQHSVSIEGSTTLVSARMTQIVQMMEETNREAAEEEGEDPDDIILTLQDVIDFIGDGTGIADSYTSFDLQVLDYLRQQKTKHKQSAQSMPQETQIKLIPFL